MATPTLFRKKLNKQLVRYCTYPGIPHEPIAKFMRDNIINRKQVFTLAKNNYLSITRHKKRYYVAVMPDYEGVPMWQLLDYASLSNS